MVLLSAEQLNNLGKEALVIIVSSLQDQLTVGSMSEDHLQILSNLSGSAPPKDRLPRKPMTGSPK